MSYEYELALGTNEKNGEPASIDWGEGRDLPTQWRDAASDAGPLLASGLGVGALVGIILGFVALSIALPFGIGAVGGAIAAPEGRRKDAAKKAAIYGGIAGIGTGLVLNIVSGATGRYVGGSGLVPFAVGLYIGYKERERS